MQVWKSVAGALVVLSLDRNYYQEKKIKQKINPRKKDPSNIRRADKTKRRKMHLKEPARLKTPKEGSTKGRNR
jgi:hypothetical protein